MIVLFFAVWVLLNGRLDWDVLLVGAILSVLLYLFSWRFLYYHPRRGWNSLKRLPRLLVLLAVLVREVFKSCFALLPYIYGGKQPDPVVARFKPERVKTTMGQVLLADCITMTPGTITGSLHNGEYLVHCLDRSMSEDLGDSAFVDKLERWEAGLWTH